jgi:hypothetical protein
MTGTAAVSRGLAIAPLVDACVRASLPVQPARNSTDDSEMSARTLATLLIHPDILCSAVIIPHRLDEKSAEKIFRGTIKRRDLI